MPGDPSNARSFRFLNEPRWYLWEGGFLLIARAQGEVPPHAHHALQIVIGLDGNTATRGEHGDWRFGRGVIVRPDAVVFGQKNAQQAAVARKMIGDLNFPVQVLVQPTVREPDGLPFGSRNRLLSAVQREDAGVLYRSLQRGKELVETGVRNVDRVVAEATHILSQRRRVRVIYVSMVDRDTMEPERQVVPGRSMLAIAVWVDEVRLIDNIIL